MFSELIKTYREDNAFPLIEQVEEAIITKNPALLHTFYINYNLLPLAAKQKLTELQDFTLFAREFTKEVRLIVSEQDMEFFEKINKIDCKVRIKNFMYDEVKGQYLDLIDISDINSAYSDKIIMSKGTISNIIESNANVKKLRYVCSSCGDTIDMDFNNIEGTLDRLPELCRNQECNTPSSYQMERVIGGVADYQELVIEEIMNESSDKDAQSISVLVEGDLVGKFSLGDNVIFSGNLRFDMSSDAAVTQLKNKLGLAKYYRMLSGYAGSMNGIKFKYIIECNYMEQVDESNIAISNITADDIAMINDMRKDPDLLKKCKESFAPDIYGYDIVKEVLLYQGVGGVGTTIDPTLDRRGEINTCLFGSPQTAKTRLMLFQKSITFRGRLIDGNGMSKAGLVGGVVPSGNDGKWSINAGIAVMCDKGHLFIDEFNDASDEARGSLNEILENQTATIAKVKKGTFKTRLSLTICANPPGGVDYDPRLNFNQQIGMRTSFLTRIDFIYLFLDIPRPDRDEKIADKIIGAYRKTNTAPYTREQLAKYIYYVKNLPDNIPKLSDEAVEEAKREWMSFRVPVFEKNMSNSNEVPRRNIGARQLESIIRFAYARARFFVKPEVEKEDVQAAANIIRKMLEKIAKDVNTGLLDISLMDGDKGNNDLNKEEQLFDLIRNMAQSTNNETELTDLVSEVEKLPKWKGEPPSKIEQFIRRQEQRGYLLIKNDCVILDRFNVVSRESKRERV